MTAHAILVIAALIAVTATAIVVVPLVLSWSRGRKVGRLVDQLEVIEARDVTEQRLSEDALETLMREYSAERYARLTPNQKSQFQRVLGNITASQEVADTRRAETSVEQEQAGTENLTAAAFSVATANGEPSRVTAAAVSDAGTSSSRRNIPVPVELRHRVRRTLESEPADSTSPETAKLVTIVAPWPVIYDRLRDSPTEAIAELTARVRHLVSRYQRLTAQNPGPGSSAALDRVVLYTVVEAFETLDRVRDPQHFQGHVLSILRFRLRGYHTESPGGAGTAPRLDNRIHSSWPSREDLIRETDLARRLLARLSEE